MRLLLSASSHHQSMQNSRVMIYIIFNTNINMVANAEYSVSYDMICLMVRFFLRKYLAGRRSGSNFALANGGNARVCEGH